MIMDDIWIFNVISSGDQNCWWKTRVFEDIKIKQKFKKFIYGWEVLFMILGTAII